MGIKIKQEPDVELTQSEYLSHTRSWFAVTPPPSFEAWLRRKKSK